VTFNRLRPGRAGLRGDAEEAMTDSLHREREDFGVPVAFVIVLAGMQRVEHLNRFFGFGFAGWFPVKISVRTSCASFASLSSRRRPMFMRTFDMTGSPGEPPIEFRSFKYTAYNFPMFLLVPLLLPHTKPSRRGGNGEMAKPFFVAVVRSPVHDVGP